MEFNVALRSNNTNANKKKAGRPLKGEIRIDIPRAIELRLKGNSLPDIANELGVAYSALNYQFKKLDKLIEDPILIEAYEKNRIGFLKKLQVAVGSEIFDAAKLKKASVNNLAYAFRQFYECERLESGKSTANICYADILKERTGIDKQLEELRKEWSL